MTSAGEQFVWRGRVRTPGLKHHRGRRVRTAAERRHFIKVDIDLYYELARMAAARGQSMRAFFDDLVVGMVKRGRPRKVHA
jgi:hypothetical protein